PHLQLIRLKLIMAILDMEMDRVRSSARGARSLKVHALLERKKKKKVKRSAPALPQESTTPPP
ncbi:hypothetical protein Tco_1179727, partial [Tanacetum coccineum]